MCRRLWHGRASQASLWTTSGEEIPQLTVWSSYRLNTYCKVWNNSLLTGKNDLAKIRPKKSTESMLSLILGGWEDKKNYKCLYQTKREKQAFNSFFLMENKNSAILSLTFRVTEG